MSEGKRQKFVKAVEQITFNGAYAAEKGQPVLYVTERCVFRRSRDGMELIEVAPGIDIDRDILAPHGFHAHREQPGPDGPAHLRDQPMHLEETLLGLGIAERVSYDAERNIALPQPGGDARAQPRRRRPRPARRRGAVPDDRQEGGAGGELRQLRDRPAVADTYAAMLRYLETHYYTTASRYTTSAFLRVKLGEALSRRRVAPHIFETADEAQAFVQATGAENEPDHAA